MSTDQRHVVVSCIDRFYVFAWPAENGWAEPERARCVHRAVIAAGFPYWLHCRDEHVLAVPYVDGVNFLPGYDVILFYNIMFIYL